MDVFGFIETNVMVLTTDSIAGEDLKIGEGDSRIYHIIVTRCYDKEFSLLLHVLLGLERFVRAGMRLNCIPLAIIALSYIDRARNTTGMHHFTRARWHS